MKLRPIGDRVIAEPMEMGERMVGGIIITGSVNKEPSKGRVLAVGGEELPKSIKVGDIVLYFKFGGQTMRGISIISKNDILAVVDEE